MARTTHDPAAPRLAAPAALLADETRGFLPPRLLDAGWYERVGTARAVRATPPEREALSRLLGVETASLDAP